MSMGGAATLNKCTRVKRLWSSDSKVGLFIGEITLAKKSPAKIKKLAAEAKRSAALSRDAKNLRVETERQERDLIIDKYDSLDEEWRIIGLAASARRSLVDDGLYQVSDLRKVSLAAIKELHGMGPNEIRILINEMNKLDLRFRK